MIAHLTQVTLILAAISMVGAICLLLIREQWTTWRYRRRIDERVRKLSALGEGWQQNKNKWTPEAYDRLMKDIREV